MIVFDNMKVMHFFQGFLIITLIIGFYMLYISVSKKNYKDISAWRFPMLLAILLETFT
jgi:hypothetical protein